MKAIVTGGAGFIGSHLVEALVAEGALVHVIDNLATGHREWVNPQAVLHVLDVGDAETRELIVREQPDVVFHLAAQVDVQRSIREPDYDASVNILGTINVLEACCQASVKKLVYASSCAVYGDCGTELIREEQPTCPISFYGISKLTPESFIRLFHQMHRLQYTILRYANVYGPRQTPKGEGGVVAIFLDRIKRGMPLQIHGDGEQTRDFVYVKDVVRANLAAIGKGDNQIIHVSTAARTSINQLVDYLKDIHGADIPVEYWPERPGDIRNSCLANRKAYEQLGWQPEYGIRQGLAETYSFVMNSR
ncbi:NAD-dependent epimerase/dehydratase family protein [Effusibacillus pohliae]|uniref:NAD-dependent epimerase/dehydratase family protein n=1 Tax=Effusibacillus pohliae TaxID=232270 RepID=UPI0003636132|nr:NAD-dependent epimerase/dehydratase family protein [Effusibacillus pohliae]